MSIEYKLLKTLSPESLETEVNNHIAEGYELYGHTLCAPHKTSGSAVEYTQYLQAVTKKKAKARSTVTIPSPER